jgi:hypothetical protein
MRIDSPDAIVTVIRPDARKEIVAKVVDFKFIRYVR